MSRLIIHLLFSLSAALLVTACATQKPATQQSETSHGIVLTKAAAGDCDDDLRGYEF